MAGEPKAPPATLPMPIPKLKHSPAASALIGIWTISLAAFIIGMLYFAREVLIPLTLAALLTFVLAPLVSRLERWLGRVLAVLLVISLILAAGASAGWVLTRQLANLATKLPDYKQNIQTKLRALKTGGGGRFVGFWETVEELKKDLPGASPDKPGIADPIVPVVKSVLPIAGNEIAPTNPFQIVRVIIAPLLGPLGTTALVLLLVIFMLLKREDLRNRFIRLIGQGRISATTSAMVEAGARVTRYLLTLLLLNLVYGISIGLGLYFIGVPNAILWGVTAGILRFIPYIGPWIGATFPILLSLAISPGWTMPLLTTGLFVGLELLNNNVLEPWIYGSNTGVAPVALIFSAVCWTWLWGPTGLVLATPMTVCLVVMGRHIPRLSFLSILLSNEEALTPAQDCYYRLLTIGEHDEMGLVDSYLKSNSLTELYDSVIIPVIRSADNDHQLEFLDDAQHALVLQSLRDILEELGTRKIPGEINPDKAKSTIATSPSFSVFCLPARAERDELAGEMLKHLLLQQGFEAQSAPSQLSVSELIGLVEKAGADVVCISVVAPSKILHARFLCLKLRAHLPRQRIVVGLWGGTENLTDATRRVLDAGAIEVFTTFTNAVQLLPRLMEPKP